MSSKQSESPAARARRCRRLPTAAEGITSLVGIPFLIAASLPAQAEPRATAISPTELARIASAAGAAAVAIDRPDPGSSRRWLRGTRYKASVDGEAFTFVPFLGADTERDLPVGFRLRSVLVAGKAIGITCRDLREDGSRITVVRDGLEEVYDATLEQVEQSFRFERLPARGALEIVLAVSTELVPAADGDDLRFDGAPGGVRYHDLVVTDASGRRLSLPIRWSDGAVHLDVPADFVAKATLPLVVDPVVNGRSVATTTDQRMLPDVAWDEAVQEFLVVWQVPFSASDWDVQAVRCDFFMNPLAPPFWFDVTTENWYRPRVACRAREGMFLVVASVDQFLGPYRIRARRFQALGSTRAVLPAFDIENMWMAGGRAGDNYTPDVGADPSPNAPAPFTVVWSHVPFFGNGDILFRQVDVDGSLASATTALTGGSLDDRAPSISKSAGSGSYGIAWVQYGPWGSQAHMQAAALGRDGTLRVAPFYLDATANDAFVPSVSTVADLPGRSVFLVAWTQNYDQAQNTGRLQAAVVGTGSGPTLVGRYDLSTLLGIPASTMACLPSVDSDGLRFVVLHTERASPGSGFSTYELRVSTLALDGTALLVHENRTLLRSGDPNPYSSSIASRYGGGLADSRSYGAVAGTTAGDVLGWLYNGLQPGSFWSPRTGGCGLWLSYSGYPVLGHAIDLLVPGSDPVRGILFGFPIVPVVLPFCPSCTIGVQSVATLPSPYHWEVPYVPAAVGVTLSAQGYSLGSPGACLGNLRLSDIIDFTLR